MCENFVLFCLNCKKGIYSFNTSPQVEKKEKKGMMDINLKSIRRGAVVKGVEHISTHLLIDI